MQRRYTKAIRFKKFFIPLTLWLLHIIVPVAIADETYSEKVFTRNNSINLDKVSELMDLKVGLNQHRIGRY